MICAIQKHACLYGPEGLIIEKPIVKHEKMSAEKNAQLQAFLTDKSNIIMSSYKTDSITNELIYYLKNSKDVL